MSDEQMVFLYLTTMYLPRESSTVPLRLLKTRKKVNMTRNRFLTRTTSIFQENGASFSNSVYAKRRDVKYSALLKKI